MTNDPHSYADLSQTRTQHVVLDLTVDFATRTLRGSATLRFAQPTKGPVDLDSRGLVIEQVHVEGQPVDFDLGETDAVLGERLRVHLDRPVSEVTVVYATSPEATGLMWLDAAQTSGDHPFLLSQGQAIHARSFAPLQDTPLARITYDARITVPAFATAVMSAAPGERTDADSTRTFTFSMPQPIPPYLLALAVGELESRELGPRCRVFAEPAVVDGAAWEFADAERMLEEAEALFGPYRWERYDFIVLPASFPLGGMENPRMTFLTPTLLAGDRSLVGVLAHELAHSWTGNLVTNATNENFWLNEGWTVWAERRILERLYGDEEAVQQSVLGRETLDAVLADLTAAGRITALTYDQTGMDPDEEFSSVPYEKGFLLITALERAVGRERFDAFVAAYIERFAFQSIDTGTFVAFLEAELPDHGVDLDVWLHQEGLPDDAPAFHSERFAELVREAEAGKVAARDDWTTNEKLLVLARLPGTVDAAQVATALGIDERSNAELRSAWLALAVRTGHTGIEQQLTDFLDTIGRTKLLKPVYRALVARPETRAFAEQRYAHNAHRLHGSTRGVLTALLA